MIVYYSSPRPDEKKLMGLTIMKQKKSTDRILRANTGNYLQRWKGDPCWC